MTKNIIWASLRARPVRTAISVFAVALEVTLILTLVGLTTGIVDETGRRVAGVGADILFQPPEASYFMSLNTSVMPIEARERLAAVEGVTAVAPILLLVNPGSGFNLIYGIEPESWTAVSGGFEFIDGRMFESRNEVLVDDWYADDLSLKVGDEITLLTNHQFTISGIVENGKGARVFLPYATAEEINGRPGKASMFYIKVVDENQIKPVIQRMESEFEGYKVADVREFASLMFSASSTLLDTFFQVIVFVGVCIGVLVIFLSMYTTITERTREIGILRSLGASKRFIVALIVQESVLLCIAGILMGIGVSFVLAYAIKAVFPTMVVLITPGWIVRGTLLAILSGVIGSLYPSIKAATKDPIEALAYE